MKFPYKKDYQLKKEDVVDLIIYGIMGLMGFPVKLIAESFDDIRADRKKPSKPIWNGLVKTVRFVGKQKIKLDDSLSKEK